MTIAYDWQSQTNGASSPISHSHAAVGTARGVLVFVSSNTTTDYVTGVTYGGVAMSEVAGSPQSNAATPGIVHAYFLGASVPTGTQTVAVSLSSGVSHAVACFTVTASDDVSVLDVDFASAMSDANGVIGGTLSLGGSDGFCALGFVCDVASSGSVAPITNWTATQEFDMGSEIAGSYRYTIVGTSDVAYEIDMTAQRDAIVFGVALREGVVSGAPTLSDLQAVSVTATTVQGTYDYAF